MVVGRDSTRFSILFETEPKVAFHFPIFYFPTDGAVALSDVVPEFAASLDQLRSTLSEHLCTPHNFGGVDIAGGERLHAIVGGLCIAVDSTQNISPPRFDNTFGTLHYTF